MWDLTTLAQIYVEVYGPVFPILAVIFVVACVLLGIFMALVAMAMSRT
jgi:hypothetical protein